MTHAMVGVLKVSLKSMGICLYTLLLGGRVLNRRWCLRQEFIGGPSLSG